MIMPYLCHIFYVVFCAFVFQALKVSMTKHPSCLKLHGVLEEKIKQVTDTAITLYEGPVRDLCPLAPNNVNTMAVAAMAAGNLGFNKVSYFDCTYLLCCIA